MEVRDEKRMPPNADLKPTMNSQESSPNDKPITQPDEDRFGMDTFAQALATAIRNIKAPEGTVIALNGPWGLRQKQRRQSYPAPP